MDSVSLILLLISEILKAFNNTEITKWELAFDYIPILYSFASIEKEAAKSTLRTIFDEITYNISIGRELNCRRKDLLFVFETVGRKIGTFNFKKLYINFKLPFVS